MKKALSYLIGFGVLIFLYIALKYLGVIGRQFPDGENIRKDFTLLQSGQEFQFPLESHRRGIFRYSAYLVFKDKKLAPVSAFQTAELTFTEQFCDDERILGQSNLKIKVEPNSVSYSGIGRYGALIRTPILQRRKRVCLTVYVDKLSEPILDDLNLSIFVSNTRPCWGIECMLD